MAVPDSPSARIEPMLAKAVAAVPAPDSVPGGLGYEPKWDGFRSIVAVDGTDEATGVELGSRGGKSLTRYFPELVAAFARLAPRACVLDGEIVVATTRTGRLRLDWDALTQRVHPAASRVAKLSVETPAMFVGFDLLADGDDSLLDVPFAERHARLEALLGDAGAPLFLTRTTTDAALAERWLAEFEGAGLDGVVAKPLAAPYAPGKRTMLKIKHHRTADVVAMGYRVHASGAGVGSLLVGLYGPDGELRQVGGVSAFTDRRRRGLVDELAPLVVRDADGAPVVGAGERSRFTGSKDVSFVPLRPERVLEVRYDQLEGQRFRHTVQFERWRPDRDAASCTYDQLDVPARYDLADVLA